MEMEIRALREDEMEQAYYVGIQAFLQGSRDMSRFADPDRLPRTVFGVWDERGLQAMTGVIPFQVYFGEELELPMAGVAAVASLPASRGRGYAGRCLRFALERMRDSGQPISTLYPFSFDYYERLGWAWVGGTRTYELPTRILRPTPETERVRAATPADRPAIAEAYARYAKRYRGMVVRDDRLWNTVLNSTEKQYRYVYLYEEGERVEGYLSYIGGKRDQTTLTEFTANTPAARRALLGLLRRHEMQIDKFRWEAPGDDPLWSALMHWDLKTTLEPTAMGRVVDVGQAMRALKPGAGVSGSAVILVHDEHAPWNTGRWAVEWSDGGVSVSSASASPDVELSIQALSQAYFGTPSLQALRRAEKLAAFDERAFQELKGLLAGPPMWLNHGF